MSFINEPIPAADFAAQRFAELDERFPVGAVHADEWTINKKTGAFLRLLTVGREDWANRSDWVLSIAGRRFIVRTELASYAGARGQHGVAHYVLTLVDGYSPDALPAGVLEELRHVLTEALTTYADDGLHSTSASFEAHVGIAGEVA